MSVTEARRNQQICVAVVGLGYGSMYVPIYAQHPAVSSVVICDTDNTRLDAVGEQFDIQRRARRFEEVLDDDTVDAVHLVTPMPAHAEQAIAVMEAGKDCACAVPMAISAEDVQRVLTAQASTGRTYMMMETAVYTRNFLYVQELVESGEFGRIQFVRGSHYCSYEHWPSWKWYSPMQYATHAVAPLLRLTGTRAASVRCLGSGLMAKRFTEPYGNPYPVETAIFELTGQPHPIAAEVTRIAFQTVRPPMESFDIYGDRLGFESPRTSGSSLPASLQRPTLFREDSAADRRGRHPPVSSELVDLPDRNEHLPKALDEFARSGPAGAHPHLVHEFVSSIVEGRPPSIDARTAAEWTLPGIYAHESAMSGGRETLIPDLTRSTDQAYPVHDPSVPRPDDTE